MHCTSCSDNPDDGLNRSCFVSIHHGFLPLRDKNAIYFVQSRCNGHDNVLPEYFNFGKSCSLIMQTSHNKIVLVSIC